MYLDLSIYPWGLSVFPAKKNHGMKAQPKSVRAIKSDDIMLVKH